MGTSEQARPKGTEALGGASWRESSEAPSSSLEVMRTAAGKYPLSASDCHLDQRHRGLGDVGQLGFPCPESAPLTGLMFIFMWSVPTVSMASSHSLCWRG